MGGQRDAAPPSRIQLPSQTDRERAYIGRGHDTGRRAGTRGPGPDRRRGGLRALLRALIPVGYRLACGMLQDRQLAEDAVQEAAMSAWRKLHRLRSGSRMEP